MTPGLAYAIRAQQAPDETLFLLVAGVACLCASLAILIWIAIEILRNIQTERPAATDGQRELVKEAMVPRAQPITIDPPQAIAALQPRRNKLRRSRKSTAPIDREMRAERKRIYERLFARKDTGATVP